MENLACIIFVFAIYCIFACAAYCPKTTATVPAVDPAAPIDYFPEENTTQPAIAASPAPVVTFDQPKPPTVDLAQLGVRELYKLASQAGYKNVRKMSKVRLVQCLRGSEPAQIA